MLSLYYLLQYCPATPVSASLYNASKLESLLQDNWKRLDAEVESILCQSCQDPLEKIMDIGKFDFLNF